MKNTIIIIPAFILLMLSSCSMNKKTGMSNYSNDGSCQLVKDKYGNPMLWGKCSPKAFQQKPFNEWYQQQFSSYTADSALCSSLKMNAVKVDIFMGTWCGDSKREVPRMLKVFNYCGVTEDRLRLFTVNNSDSAFKQTLGNEAAKENIFRVPTFIFYNEAGKELGRIIESPVQTLEKDMEAIISGKSYIPRYAKQNRLLEFCRTATDEQFGQNINAEIGKVKDTNFAGYTLNNIVYVLMAGENVKRAGEIVQINQGLFPGDVSALAGKARYLKYTGRAGEAADCCRQILQKEPANAAAKEILASLNK